MCRPAGIDLDARASQIKLGQLELGVRIAEEGRGLLVVFGGGFQIWPEANFRNSPLGIGRQRRQRYPDVASSWFVVDVDPVRVLLDDGPKEFIGLVVVGQRPTRIGVERPEMIPAQQ